MKVLPLFVSGLLVSSVSILAQEPVLWNGEGDGSAFEDQFNWMGNSVPDAGNEVSFTGVGYVPGEVVLSGYHSIARLSVSGLGHSFRATSTTDGLNLGTGQIGVTSGSLQIGSGGVGTFRAGYLSMTDSSVTLQSDLELSGGLGSNNVMVVGVAGNSTFNHNAGNLTIRNGNLYLARSGAGTYNLFSGGTLNIGGSSLRGALGSEGSYNFNWNGGRLVVTDSNLTTSIDSTIVSGRSVIDTNGLSATWSGSITSAANTGELAKEGEGTLVFDGETRQMHNFATLHGTTRQTAGDTSSVGFLVGYGAGNESTYEMDGGTLSVYSVPAGEGQSAQTGTLRIGDYGGTGIFNHNAGDVTMEEGTSLNVGNLSGVVEGERVAGDGTYNLNGGTLTLRGGLHNVGRSQGVHTANGAVNMSDGLLLAEGGQLILGSREAATVAGSGIFTQTGGVADFTNGALRIGSQGHGVYNFLGGELRIGGTDRLTARYGNSGGTYEFNFGNGRLVVSGSNLVTNVAATILADRTATIDTNGLNATFNSTLSGPGDLRKEGEGRLTVQTLSAKKVEVNEGEMTVTTLMADEVELASGTELRTGSHAVSRFASDNASLGATTGIFRIASGTRLEGTGTLLSATEVSGTVYVGSSTQGGSFTVEGSFAARSGSRFEMGLFANDTAAGSYSQIVGEEGFDFSGTIAIHLRFGEDVDFTDAFWESFGQEWLLFAGDILGNANFVITSDESYFDYGRFELVEDEVNGVSLRWQAIPEPSTYALMALSGAGLALLRRQKR